MAGENDPVRLAILAKIAAWTTVLESYDAAVSRDGPAGEPGVITSVGSAAGTSRAQAYSQIDLPVGVFRDKSLKEAIPIYLAACRRKQTNKEITTGLQAGGFPTTATNFEPTVGTALYRLKKEGVVLRFPDGWDLASSYPDNLRGRLEKDAAAPRKKLRAKIAKKNVRGKSQRKAKVGKRGRLKLLPAAGATDGDNKVAV